MTFKTSNAIVSISPHTLVLFVGRGFVVVMAVNATEKCKISGGCMTIGAVIPFSLVLAGVYREVLPVMIEGGWLPCTY
jgi:hypothetical protein